MRFKKGSLELSYGQDCPLLRQVMHCRFVTHDQIYDFLRLGCHEMNRQSFNWRIRRLAAHDLVLRHHLPAVASGFIYSLAPVGALRLQGMGEHYSGPVSGLGKKIDEATCFHWVELNDVHLALARRHLVEEWISEVEIRSRNELTNFGYAKDYDAVVSVRVGYKSRRFALEYERSPKALREYSRIEREIEAENHVEVFLYLMPNDHLLEFVGQCFSKTRRRLYLGLAQQFTELGLDAPVVEASTGRELAFRKAL